jgi:hypothetical protein
MKCFAVTKHARTIEFFFKTYIRNSFRHQTKAYFIESIFMLKIGLLTRRPIKDDITISSLLLASCLEMPAPPGVAGGEEAWRGGRRRRRRWSRD